MLCLKRAAIAIIVATIFTASVGDTKPPLLEENHGRIPKLEPGHTRYTLTLLPREDEADLTVELVSGVSFKAGPNPLVYGGEFRRNYFRPLRYYRVTEVTELESSPLMMRIEFVPADSLFLPYDSGHTVVIDVPEMKGAFNKYKIELKHRFLRRQPKLESSGTLTATSSTQTANASSEKPGEQ